MTVMFGVQRLAFDGLHELGLPVGVGLEIVAVFLGQTPLQRRVLVAILIVASEPVPEGDVPLPPVAVATFDEVDLMGAAPVRPPPEVAAIRQVGLELGHVLVAQGLDRTDDHGAVVEAPDPDLDVDHRLRGQAGHRGAPDVLVGDDPGVEGRAQLGLGHRVGIRPPGIVLDDHDP